MPSQQHPSLNNFSTITADIKVTLTAANLDLCLDIQNLACRVQEVEKMVTQHGTYILHINHTVDTRTKQLRDLQCHIEDLDNRGWRHSLQVHELPESVDTDQIPTMVMGIFNNLLDRPHSTPIEIERIHQALRPKGWESDL